MSPDGAVAVVGTRTVRRGRYVSHLQTADPTRRTRPVAITSGRVRDTSPRISPDGSRVAFLRAEPDDDDTENDQFVAHCCAPAVVAGPDRRTRFCISGSGR